MDSINMNLGAIGFGVFEWICLDQDRVQWKVLVNVVINLQFPLNAGNF
jgi:hypothetical protein